MTFSFRPYGHVLRKFWKNEQPGGLLVLKSFENEKLFFCLEITEIDKVGQLWVEKNDFGHKTHVFKVESIFRG